MNYIAGEEIREEYFDYLCRKVNASVHDIPLLLLLFNRLFEWSVPNDKNRANDGVKLRCSFHREEGIVGEISGPCNVLEMLIGLAIRCDSDITGEPDVDNSAYWFWQMIGNLGIRDMNLKDVGTRLNIWMGRKFDKNGFGGLFPIRKTKNDQRKIEIWYQLSEWLGENWG